MIPALTFAAEYDRLRPEAMNDEHSRPRGVSSIPTARKVIAHELNENDLKSYFPSGRFIDRWGGTVTVAAGDWLATPSPAADEVYVIPRSLFSIMYERHTETDDELAPSQSEALDYWKGVLQHESCLYCRATSILAKRALKDGAIEDGPVVEVEANQAAVETTIARKLYAIGAVKWRCIFFTAQVIASFSSISSETGEKVPFPDPAGTFAAALGISNLDVFSFISLRCMLPETNFYTMLLIKTIGPFCFITMLFCIPLACYIAQRPHRQAWHTSARLSLLCLEVALPSITTTIVQTLICDQYDNGSFLRAELSCACDDSHRREKWVYYAGLMFAVYPVGASLGFICPRCDID